MDLPIALLNLTRGERSSNKGWIRRFFSCQGVAVETGQGRNGWGLLYAPQRGARTRENALREYSQRERADGEEGRDRGIRTRLILTTPDMQIYKALRRNGDPCKSRAKATDAY